MKALKRLAYELGLDGPPVWERDGEGFWSVWQWRFGLLLALSAVEMLGIGAWLFLVHSGALVGLR